jgi:transketolase C-terminal domain/subunit
VYEALAAADECAGNGIDVAVIDMPSIDEELLLSLHDSRVPVFLAEQNNGFIWQNLLKMLYRRRKFSRSLERVFAINTLDGESRPQFIHSGTYEELAEAFQLSGARLARIVMETLPKTEPPRFPDSLT